MKIITMFDVFVVSNKYYEHRQYCICIAVTLTVRIIGLNSLASNINMYYSSMQECYFSSHIFIPSYSKHNVHHKTDNLVRFRFDCIESLGHFELI